MSKIDELIGKVTEKMEALEPTVIEAADEVLSKVAFNGLAASILCFFGLLIYLFVCYIAVAGKISLTEDEDMREGAMILFFPTSFGVIPALSAGVFRGFSNFLYPMGAVLGY